MSDSNAMGRPSSPPGRVLNERGDITLGLLNAVADDRALTQRGLADELGIALGLANVYLKRCVKKGLVKVTQAPANRYVYYLTPQGFAEKSRLTSEFLFQSFNLFRTARVSYGAVFESCTGRGWKRVALCGTGDLCEVAILCAREQAVAVSAIVAFGAERHTRLGLPVVPALADAGRPEAVVVTDMTAPQETYDRLVADLGRDRVLAPQALLNISIRPPTLMEME